MKYLSIIPLLILCASCSLFPKKVEFGQSKVPQMPVKPATLEQQEKQGLQYVKYNIDRAYEEGLKENISTNVMEPLNRAKVVIEPVVESIGHPTKPLKEEQLDSDKVAKDIVKAIDTQTAKYDAKLDKLADKLEDLKGKKIEDTGIIKIGYFWYVGGVFILFVIIVTVVKIFVFGSNPVTAGLKVVQVGASLAKKGLSEVIEGGEYFKKLITEKVEDPKLTEQVLDLFAQAQQTKQSRDVQNVIRNLTN